MTSSKKYYLTQQEVAEMLGLALKTVSVYCDQRKIGYIVKVTLVRGPAGKKYRRSRRLIPRPEVFAFMARRAYQRHRID